MRTAASNAVLWTVQHHSAMPRDGAEKYAMGLRYLTFSSAEKEEQQTSLQPPFACEMVELGPPQKPRRMAGSQLA